MYSDVALARVGLESPKLRTAEALNLEGLHPKPDPQLRPLWQQAEERVEALIRFFSRACGFLKPLEPWLARSGLGAPARRLAELAPISVVEMILPPSLGYARRMHCLIHPDERQRIRLARWGLILPRPLGLPRWGGTGAQHSVDTKRVRHGHLPVTFVPSCLNCRSSARSGQIGRSSDMEGGSYWTKAAVHCLGKAVRAFRAA